MIPFSTFQESKIVLLLTSAYTFHMEEAISWHFLLLVICYNMEHNVIFDGDLTKLFEFHMEENELGQLSQYSDCLQDRWPMPGFPKGAGIFLFNTTFRPSVGWVGTTYLFRLLTVQNVTGALPVLPHSSLWHSAFRYRDSWLCVEENSSKISVLWSSVMKSN